MLGLERRGATKAVKLGGACAWKGRRTRRGFAGENEREGMKCMILNIIEWIKYYISGSKLLF